ncbi:MAG: hypothetical protein ACPG05_00965 [Bdellovibrionales bacterium]
MILKHSFLILIISCFALSACRSDEASVKAGHNFGKEHSILDCSNRAFDLIVECGVGQCEAVPKDFAKGCAMTAKIDRKYCKSMPVASAFDSVKWMDKECVDHKDPKTCKQILKYAVGRCITDSSQAKQSKAQQPDKQLKSNDKQKN